MTLHSPTTATGRPVSPLLFALSICALALVHCAPRFANHDQVVAIGDKLYQQGDYETAAQVYRRALRENPNAVDLHLRLAQAELQTGRLGNALGALRRVIEIEPRNSAAFLAYACLSLWPLDPVTPPSEGLLRDLGMLADRVITARPQAPEVLLVRGWLALLQGDAITAVQSLQAASNASRSSEALPWLVAAQAQAGQIEQAAGLLANASLSSPVLLSQQFWLAVAEGDWQHAGEILHRACRPPSGCWPTLAIYYDETGNRAAATALLEQVAERPGDPEQLLTAAELALRTARLAQAEQWYRQAWERTKDPRARAGWIQTLLVQGRRQQALDEIDQWLGSSRDDTWPSTLRAVALARDGAAHTLAVFTRPSVSPETDALLRFIHGELLAYAGQPVQAAEQYRMAQRLSPMLLPAWEAWLNLSLARGDVGEARVAASELLAHYPWHEAAQLTDWVLGERRRPVPSVGWPQTGPDESWEVLWWRARWERAQARSGRVNEWLLKLDQASGAAGCRASVALAQQLFDQRSPERALAVLEGRLRRDPQCFPARWMLTRLLLQRGDLVEARRRAEPAAITPGAELQDQALWAQALWVSREQDKVAELYKARLADPRSRARARYALGVLALERADFSEARLQFEAVVSSEPNYGPALNNLAYVLAELGVELERARDLAERAVATQPDNPAYCDTLGWVLAKAGRREEAVAWLRKAVRMAPESPLHRYHLGLVLYEAGAIEEARAQLRRAASLNLPAHLRAPVEQLLGRPLPVEPRVGARQRR